MELRLPTDKLSRLKDMIEQWRSRRTCTKRELLSLLGSLHHACQVVQPGRSFLRRIIELSKVATQLHHHIQLNAEFKSDLEWWALFLTEWNGVGMMSNVGWTPNQDDVMVTSDASGSWGCGAYTSAGQWFQYKWPPSWVSVDITAKELLLIIMASVVWGHSWTGKRVKWVCDNAAAVDIINSRKNKDKLAMHLVRCVFFFAAEWRFTLSAVHLAGKLNVAADALSRDNLLSFFQHIPEAASRTAEPISDAAQELLVYQRLDWTSPAAVSGYFAKGLSASTNKTYHSGKDRFLRFCQEANWEPIPLTEPVLCSFVSYLAMQGLKYHTIKVYLSSVRHMQIEANMPDPFNAAAMPKLEYVLKGVKQVEAENGKKSRTRLPITSEILKKLKKVWEPSADRFDTHMIWAACCLSVFAFLRIGELTVPSESSFDPKVHLTVRDIAADKRVSPSLLKITIKQSKTDPFRKGTDLYVGCTSAELCPVAALWSYLQKRGAGPGPPFRFEDGRPLMRERFVAALRRRAGLNDKDYCSHSFRIGAATTAATKGMEDSVIKTLGRWESLAYLQYVKIPRATLAGYTQLLAT